MPSCVATQHCLWPSNLTHWKISRSRSVGDQGWVAALGAEKGMVSAADIEVPPGFRRWPARLASGLGPRSHEILIDNAIIYICIVVVKKVVPLVFRVFLRDGQSQGGTRGRGRDFPKTLHLQLAIQPILHYAAYDWVSYGAILTC